jgi:hypothetical protein
MQHFASDNYAGICPEALAACWRPTTAMSARMATTSGRCARRPPARTVRDRLRRVLRLQRHGGQFAGARRALPVLPQRHLPPTGARRNRRVRRAGILFQRRQAAGGRRRAGQADAGGDRRSGDPAQRHPLSQAESGDPDAGDRSRHRLPSRRIAAIADDGARARGCACTWTAPVLPTPSPALASVRPS